MYEYRAALVRVIDGDTLVVVLDLGFDVKLKQTLRLAGINTPELHAADATARAKAKAARERLASLVGTGDLTIRTVKDAREKYGRYLAHVVLPDGMTANDVLLAENLAEPYA